MPVGELTRAGPSAEGSGGGGSADRIQFLRGCRPGASIFSWLEAKGCPRDLPWSLYFQEGTGTLACHPEVPICTVIPGVRTGYFCSSLLVKANHGPAMLRGGSHVRVPGCLGHWGLSYSVCYTIMVSKVKFRKRPGPRGTKQRLLSRWLAAEPWWRCLLTCVLAAQVRLVSEGPSASRLLQLSARQHVGLTVSDVFKRLVLRCVSEDSDLVGVCTVPILF